jgi:hypothetical protein
LTNPDLDVLVLFMSDATNMAERHREGLAELADLGLALARALQGQALAAVEDAQPAVAADLSLAFQRVSRAVRQTYALEAKLERDCKAAAREAAKSEAQDKIIRAHERRRQVRKAISPLLWTEGEEEESEALLDALDACLSEASQDDDFLDIPLEACIARIRHALGLPPEGSDPQTPKVVIWRSSG